MDFIKYEGLGNDFVLVDDRELRHSLLPVAIRTICDRHFGVGADGLIVVRESGTADGRMVFYNPDASEAEMCGNGVRAFAKYLVDSGIVQGSSLVAETGGGMKAIDVEMDGGSVVAARVDMGTPSFRSEDVPALIPTVEAIDVPLDVDGERLRATCVSMGNPHCVLFVDDVRAVSVEVMGPRIERLAVFPERANVEFVRVVGPAEIELRVWERGAGETLACGTGACAAVAAAARTGRTGRRVDARLPGGVLDISWEPDDRILMSGPVKEVFRGSLNPESLVGKGTPNSE